MTFGELLEALSTAGLKALAGFDHAAATNAGLTPHLLTSFRRVHDTYYGPTRFRKQQRDALILALGSGRSIDQLAYIESKLRRVEVEADRWALRCKALRITGSFRRLKQQLAELINLPAKAPTPGVRILRSRCGYRTIIITASERDIADLEFFLRQNLNPDLPAGPQMLARFLTLFHTPTTTSTDGTDAADVDEVAGEFIARAVPRPMILIPLDVHLRILNGDGDDTVLHMTDGTTITGAEYLAQHLGDTLDVAVFHPVEGAVNMYRGARFANEKQRDLAALVTPGCPVPGCRHAAQSCETHHIHAWSQGGDTNAANLVPLCRFHNRTNDDNPHKPKWGRIDVDDGRPRWHSPRGVPVDNPIHPPGAMQLLFP